MAEMNRYTLFLELLLGGFFAVACLRTALPVAADRKVKYGVLFRFPGRIERLRRSRWQWFSMVLLLLVARLQNQLPLMLEFIVAIEFIVFMALPAASDEGMTAAVRMPRG
jgi:hypothetical protein